MERIGFAYGSLGLMVMDSSETDFGLTLFKTGAVAMGLGRFVQQYGYFCLEFDINEDGVGKLGMGKVYRLPAPLPPQSISLAPS